VNHALRLDDAEVVHQRAGWFDRLGADARSRRLQVFPTQLGQQPLQGFVKGPLAEGAPQLAQARSLVLPGHAPEAAVGRQGGRVAQRHGGLAIPLALQGQHGVRPRFDAAADSAREVNA
jgi:hypothetical protein